MRTEELIAQLSAAPAPVRRGWLGRGVALALALGTAVAFVLWALILGPRPGLPEAIMPPVTMAKTLLPLAMALLAVVLTLRAARPGTAAGPAAPMLVLVPLTAVSLWIWSFWVTPASARMAVFLGHSIPVCLPMIVVLSVPILTGLTRALRRGAPEHPGRLGALAGLGSAGIATAIYSLFCIEDAPMFYVTWYGLAILIVTGIGAAVGRRALRW